MDADKRGQIEVFGRKHSKLLWDLETWGTFRHACQVCRMPRAFRSMCPGNESDQVMFAMFAMFMMFIFPPEVPGWNSCRCTGLKKNENVRRLSTKLGMYYYTNVCHRNILEDVDTSTWGAMHERLWSKIVSNKPAAPTRHSMTLFKFVKTHARSTSSQFLAARVDGKEENQG